MRRTCRRCVCGRCVCDEYTTQVCGRCKIAYYCSKECLSSNWPRHKLFCVESTGLHVTHSPKARSNVNSINSITLTTSTTPIEPSQNSGTYLNEIKYVTSSMDSDEWMKSLEKLSINKELGQVLFVVNGATVELSHSSIGPIFTSSITYDIIKDLEVTYQYFPRKFGSSRALESDRTGRVISYREFENLNGDVLTSKNLITQIKIATDEGQKGISLHPWAFGKRSKKDVISKLSIVFTNSGFEIDAGTKIPFHKAYIVTRAEKQSTYKYLVTFTRFDVFRSNYLLCDILDVGDMNSESVSLIRDLIVKIDCVKSKFTTREFEAIKLTSSTLRKNFENLEVVHHVEFVLNTDEKLHFYPPSTHVIPELSKSLLKRGGFGGRDSSLELSPGIPKSNILFDYDAAVVKEFFRILYLDDLPTGEFLTKTMLNLKVDIIGSCCSIADILCIDLYFRFFEAIMETDEYTKVIGAL